MPQINLTANNATETRVLEYLQANASEVLATKINDGKKTLAGAMRHAWGEARKLAEGEQSCCVDDATVFGWIVHYFEEDHITEEKKAPAVSLPGGVKAKKPAAKKAKPVAEKPPKAKKPPKPESPAGPTQLTMFEALLTGGQA